MTGTKTISPAEEASEKALKMLSEAVTKNQCFRFEAGAGAGKTYSLIKALKDIIKKQGDSLLRKGQQVACITYTNVAKNEIDERTDNNPVIFAETIHAFSWSLIEPLQKQMREYITQINSKWKSRIEEAGGIKSQKVIYDLGYPSASEEKISLHHDDVIKIITNFLSKPKFISLLRSRFPIIFIDEYQDTNKDLAEAIIKNIVDANIGILIGLFGDHWQKIYGSNACGLIESSTGKLIEIGKEANFRSDKNIVQCLNRMRIALPQKEFDPNSEGDIYVFHSQNSLATRLDSGHWKGDLPSDCAKSYRDRTKIYLEQNGWEFIPEKTKILMLTNNLLAEEQGYRELVSAFRDTDDYLKLNDHYIKYFKEVLEPVCEYFEKSQYGEMFKVIGTNTPKLEKQDDKKSWNEDLQNLIEIRKTGTIDDVLSLLKRTRHPRLSDRVEKAERRYEQYSSLEGEEKEKERSFYNKVSIIKGCSYQEMINLANFIDDKTTFSTKHGVKGAEFKNVLVICGRGWSNYNWDNMLSWANKGIPKGKETTYERNRNLFYVACSRPQRRLALLFTQELSSDAISTLENWFGAENIIGEPDV